MLRAAAAVLAQRALRRGTTARDLDRIAERYRLATWISLGFAALLGLSLGWKAALWASGAAMIAAAITKVLWHLAAMLEDEDPVWK